MSLSIAAAVVATVAAIDALSRRIAEYLVACLSAVNVLLVGLEVLFDADNLPDNIPTDIAISTKIDTDFSDGSSEFCRRHRT